MRQIQTEISIPTNGKGLTDITEPTRRWVMESDIQSGLLTLFIRHTSASLTIQENADPDVLTDLGTFFAKLVPDDSRLYIHTAEGPDDMPAHIRSALTDVSLSIPVYQGEPVLGIWQGIYLFEHRSRPHSRSIHLHLFGE